MKNNEYWEKRIAEKTWDTYNFTEEKNRKLIELYQDASRKIREELYELAEQLSRNGTLSRTEMYRQQHLQKLEKKYRKILYELAEKIEEFAKENIEQGMQEVYERISIALDVPEFSLPDKELMQKLIEEPWRNGNFSERLWKNQKKLLKALKNVLVVGMQQGKNITDMAVELNAAMGKGFYAAHRLVRTETMHCLNQSCLQRYKDAEIKKVSFWAAKDERTCEICGAMHGKKYDIDKAPVLPVHPNCRCTYLPVVENEKHSVENKDKNDIMKLPKYQEAIIPKEKFTEYALNPEKDANKAKAFKAALGYTKDNAEELMEQIYNKLPDYKATERGDKGWGMTYQVIMDITGPNGKTAQVLTAWIKDKDTGKVRMTTVHVD